MISVTLVAGSLIREKTRLASLESETCLAMIRATATEVTHFGPLSGGAHGSKVVWLIFCVRSAIFDGTRRNNDCSNGKQNG